MTEAEFEQCINRICQGDRTGLKDIYTEYLPYLYRTVYSILQNKEDAEDVTSEFFIKLWSLAPKYQPGSGHKGYLATIARNMAIDLVRKRKREVPLEETAPDPGGGSAELKEPADGQMLYGTFEDTPEKQVVEALSIREVLDRLKPQVRQVIDMKVLGEMTFKEISELLQIPMGTVTWRYQEGIKLLRRYGYE